MKRDSGGQTAYVIKISLVDAKPAIWRRYCVPGEISLDRLHDVIQIVMGWHECHMHRFEIDGKRYAEEPGDKELEGTEEGECRLCDLVTRVKTKFIYEYDFGDGWTHELTVEQIDEVPKGNRACIGCMDGKRACPPEDVGGVDGYAEFLTALKNPKHPEYEHYLDWCGGEFDPNAFDPDAVNLELARYSRWSRPRRLSQELSVRSH